MVIRLGRPRVRGIVGDLLEVEVPLDAEGVGWPDEESPPLRLLDAEEQAEIS